MNIFHADPYKFGKGRQFKKYTSEPGICLTYRSVDFLLLRVGYVRLGKEELEYWNTAKESLF